eukprot:15704253-Heterocapsa_arctica.AAC.1
MPPCFLELTDDFELARLMLWTWVDLLTARIHQIYPVDPTANIFSPDWFRCHLPAHRALLMKPLKRHGYARGSATPAGLPDSDAQHAAGRSEHGSRQPA